MKGCAPYRGYLDTPAVAPPDGGQGDGKLNADEELSWQNDHMAILLPTLPFKQLKITQYIDEGKKKKLFKGESLRAKANTIDDPYFFYIDEGQITFGMERESGETVGLIWRNAGNAIPVEYNSFASLQPYKAHIVATENSVLFSFSQRQLYDLSMRDPDIFYEFIYVSHMTYAQLAHRISNNTFQPPATRVLVWMQKMCALTEQNEDGSYDIPCNMTVRQLSELFLIHETTGAKLFAALTREGLLQRTRTSMHIPDLGRLEQRLLEGKVGA